MPPEPSSFATSNDDDLLRHVRSADDRVARSAFEEVYARHYLSAVRFAHRLADSRETAEDVAQAVFFRLWDRRLAIEVRGTLRTYILGAIRLEAIDMLRRTNASSRAMQTTGTEAAPAGMGRPSDAPDDVADAVLLGERMRRALDALPERQRSALLLRWDHELSNDEIAAVLGIGKAAVSRLLTRAVEALRAVT